MSIRTDGQKRKPILWLNEALRREVRAWPSNVKQDLGKELTRLELGADPLHYRDMGSISPGVREIKLVDGTNNDQYRTIYLARFPEAVYVLPVVSKKTTRRTTAQDIRAAKIGFTGLVAWRQENGL